MKVQFQQIDFGNDLVPPSIPTVPADYTIGKPFVFVAEGKVFDRWSATQRGLDITEGDLDSALAIWQSGETSCALDWEHNENCAIGYVALMWKVRRHGKACLACLPAYSAEGAARVGGSSHLWSSPHLMWNGYILTGEAGEQTPVRQDFVAADTGERTGSMMIPHLAICVDPAQAHRVLTAVRLSQGVTDARPPSEDKQESLQMEELQKQIEALTAAVGALTARVDAMEKAPDEAPMAEDAKPEGEQMSDARDAQIAELTAKVDAMEKEKVHAALSDRITPGMKAGFDAAWLKGGRELVQAIYGALPAGSAVPRLHGHGEPVEPSQGTSEWARVDKLAKAKMGNGGDYNTALRAVLAENNKKAKG